MLKIVFVVLSKLAVHLLHTFSADGSGPPVLHPLFIPPDLGLGDSLDITCSLKRGSLPVQFNWIVGNRKASDITGIRINTSERRSVCIIRSIAAEHIGNYTCEASNAEGVVRVATELKVEGKMTDLKNKALFVCLKMFCF